MPKTKKRDIQNGDDLHNRNAYNYLRYLQNMVDPETKETLSKPIKEIIDKLAGVTSVYVPTTSYGNLYTEIQVAFEALDLSAEDLADNRVKRILNAIYLNNNKALENTYLLIKDVLDEHHHISGAAKKAITHRLNEGNNRSANKYYPQLMETLPKKIIALAGPDFKPQHATGIPSLRHYQYKPDHAPQEIRMGTQGQYARKAAQTSPTFETWLKVQQADESSISGISHIYFNNLGYDRDNVEGKRERRLTDALHRLNDIERKNVAIITLPADKGFFAGETILSEKKNYNREQFCRLVLAHFTDKSDRTGDVFIPKIVREQIFPGNDSNLVLEPLLDKSFTEMGLKEKTATDMLTDEEMQAVYFHFVKYELTNLILETIQPKSFNISCKDGIDRAASASLYYNLIKSIEMGSCISEEEFLRNLHGPATMVKGRGMNVHRERVWSTINHYVNKHYEDLDQTESEQTQWLIRWRDMNIPPTKQETAFRSFMQTMINTLPDTGDEVADATKVFLAYCQQLGQDKRYDKRFLMDMAHHAKAVYRASLNIGEHRDNDIQMAITSMEDRLSTYPEEIKSQGFLEAIYNFFKKVIHVYKPSKDKFQGRDHDQSAFQLFKRQLTNQKEKDAEERDEEDSDSEGVSPTGH